jgi:ABC-2 type transport system permease protein
MTSSGLTRGALPGPDPRGPEVTEPRHRAAGGHGPRRRTPLTPRITFAVAGRVLTQLRHDHRTAAMLLVLPALILTLLWWMFDEQPGATGFDNLGPPLLALIPFIVMFLVTSVTTLRERASGTLERLLAMPTGKLDLLGGYAIAFGLAAMAQSVVAVLLCVWALGLDVAGPVWMLTVVAVADAVLGTALGLFVSAFARTEFQAVQFMPAIVIPQILLCGLFIPRDAMPTVLSAISDVLPLSYAVDAMTSVSTTTSDAWGGVDPGAWQDVAVVAGFAVAALALGAATLRRRTA